LAKSDTGIFTIKNYQQAKGLSFRFFSDQEHNFEVSGPYGKGLIQNEVGTHIAFAAGTGVLCFVDLVAHLALKNLGVNVGGGGSKLNKSVDDNEYKLILYVSFPKRA